MKNSAMSKHIGKEVEAGSTLNKMELISAFNFYNEEYTKQDAIDFLIEYADEEEIEGKDLEKMSVTLGWIARLVSIDVSLPSEYDGWIEKEIAKLPNKASVTGKKAKTSFRESESSIVIAEIEELLDKEVTGDKIVSRISSFNPNKLTFSRIAAFYAPILNELNSITTDSQLKEAYSKFTKKQIKEMIARLTSIVEFTKSCSKRKTRSDAKQTSTPKNSAKAAKIVVIVNDNNNDIKILNSGSSKSLEMVGKKYQNYNVKMSYAKRVDNLSKVEASLNSVKTYDEMLNILKKAEGKEFDISTAVVNKYCRIIKEI